MKRKSKETNADKLRKYILQKLERSEKQIDFDENLLPYQDLKTLYKKLEIRYEKLKLELETEREKAKHTKLKKDSPKLVEYKKVIREIILKGEEETEQEILQRVLDSRVNKKIILEEYSKELKKFAKDFKTWRDRNKPLFEEIFNDICSQEFRNGNLKPLERSYLITTTE